MHVLVLQARYHAHFTLFSVIFFLPVLEIGVSLFSSVHLTIETGCERSFCQLIRPIKSCGTSNRQKACFCTNFFEKWAVTSGNKIFLSVWSGVRDRSHFSTFEVLRLIRSSLHFQNESLPICQNSEPRTKSSKTGFFYFRRIWAKTLLESIIKFYVSCISKKYIQLGRNIAQS